MRQSKPARIVVDVQRASPLWRVLPDAAALARKAARRAVAMGGVAVRDGASVAVSLADDARVREANRAFRGKDAPTNVLSFPAAPPDRIASSPMIGDVIVAYETIAKEAEAGARPIADHLQHLVVHGVLHLIGYDHMTDGEAERMESLETTILASLGVPDPYADAAPLEPGRE